MVSFLPFASSRTLLHLFSLLSIASLAQSQGTSSLRQGVNTVTQKEQRITGGDHVTSIFTYPYFAHTSPFSCGGVLISKRFILTAAHCVDGSMQHFRIGGLSKTDGILVEAYLFGVHPLWGNNLNSMAYDIAIYEVLDEISDIPHYPKLQKLHLTEPGIPLEVIGLGDTDYYTTSPSVSLRKGTVKYISNRDCKLEYTNVETDRITVSEMCAIGTEGQDSCFGDSGGPLLDRNHFGDDLLVGLVSWGRGCGDSRYPGVYARISTSYDWIVLAMCNAVSEREYFGFSNNPKDIPYYIDCNRDKISDDFFQYDDDFMYFGYHDDDYYFLDLDDDDFDYDLFDDDCYDLFDNDPPQQRTCQPKGEVCESNNDCCQSLECNPFHKYCYSTIDADKFSDRGSVAGGAGGAAAKATAIP